MEGCDIRRLTEFKSRYERWLWKKLGFRRIYSDLFNILYDTEFTWKVPMDENRATDGVYLRDRFCYETGEVLPDGWDDWPCSVLEMLASLALTMEESFFYDPESDTNAGTWFWEMLDNCGISGYDNSRIWKTGRLEPELVLKAVLDRGYSKDGSGGFFPLKRPLEDQRRVEIWDQMNEYVVEKMGF